MPCSKNKHPQRLLLRGSSLACLLVGTAALLTSGCAAVTNPTANGMPAHMLPNELLANSKEGYVPVDLTLLRIPPPNAYLLDVGDTLGIYVEGVVGSAETPPPVSVPDSTELPPSIGYPFPIRDDGSLSLPLVGDVLVKGKTIEQAEQAVIKAYLEKKLLRQDDYRIIVSLIRPRYVRVTVVREDATASSVTLQNNSLIGLGGTSTTIGGGQEPSGQIVELPAYQNDLLNALARTGGLPGLESRRDVLIYRGYNDPNNIMGVPCCPLDGENADVQADGNHITRIPLRTRPCEPPQITREDVTLHNGDIVVVRGLDQEVYYTGGLLPAGEFPLPLDQDLSVIEALLRARGPLLSGGQAANNLSGGFVGGGMGNPSPSQLAILRKTPGGQQLMIRVDLNEAIRDPRLNLLVQSEDVLILQENTDEAFARYFKDVFQFDFFGRYLNRSDAQGTASFVVP